MRISDLEYFDEVREYANKLGPEMMASFANGIISLLRYENLEAYPDSQVHLYRDFSPYSFYFEWKDSAGQRIMNGGLIFHGAPESQDPAEFSVTLTRQYGWSIHT